jgi:pseudouridine-5'-phosphate glycosidase
VALARAAGRPLVALESSLLAQGLRPPHNAEALARMRAAVAASGSLAVVIAVLSGVPTIGADDAELQRFLVSGAVRKAAARDLAPAIAAGADAATTVSGSLALMRRAGVRVLATGGIGGVHRGGRHDESADLMELSRTPAVVVCSGAKSLLDVAATVERLETLGVVVLGYRTSEFPGFFCSESGLFLNQRVERADEVATVYASMRELEIPGALLVVQPPPREAALPCSLVEEAIQLGLREAGERGVTGPELTPFVLAAVERATGGRSVAANLALLEANAALAGTIAAAIAGRLHSVVME